MGDKIKLWIRAMRAPFFQAAAIPVIVGTTVAWYTNHFTWYNWLLLFLALIGNVAANAGTNLINDYYDDKSGADVFNKQPTPFSGGSRVIQEKVLSPRAMQIGGLISFAITLSIGIFLVITRGLPILWLGLAGMFIGYFYTAKPIQLGYHGLGEFVTGLALGPLAVMGAYYVQVQRFDLIAYWASLPIGFLVAAILYINEFPDYEADKAAGKNHLIVLLGPKKALPGYYFIIGLVYTVIVLGALLGATPYLTLIALLNIPLALKAIRVAREHYSHPRELIPAMAATIQLHLTSGLLLSVGFIASRLVASV